MPTSSSTQHEHYMMLFIICAANLKFFYTFSINSELQGISEYTVVLFSFPKCLNTLSLNWLTYCWKFRSFSWKSSRILWQMDIQYLIASPSWHMNLLHQRHPSLKFVILSDLAVSIAFTRIARFVVSLCTCLFYEMQDYSIHSRVSSFLWSSKAFSGCLTRKCGSLSVPPMTNTCSTGCIFTSCCSVPMLCCIYNAFSF